MVVHMSYYVQSYFNAFGCDANIGIPFSSFPGWGPVNDLQPAPRARE